MKPIVDPQTLVRLQRTGTPFEQLLADNVQTLLARVSETHVLMGKMRHALGLATQIVAPAEDVTPEATDKSIDAFIEIATELTADNALTVAYGHWVRMRAAAEIAARGGQTREYYIELGRDIVGMPAKDGATRGLVKLDLDRTVREAQLLIEKNLTEEKETE